MACDFVIVAEFVFWEWTLERLGALVFADGVPYLPRVMQVDGVVTLSARKVIPPNLEGGRVRCAVPCCRDEADYFG